jgi:DNA-binding NtrC family response regulator
MPASGSSLAVATPGAPGPEPARQRQQRILVVDDEEDIRESLKALFETCLDDVEVRTAAGGAVALDILGKETIDLIVTDYKMPGMNGLEFLARAAKQGPSIPRILVTAFPDLEIAIRAINEANIENFFTKPFDADQVLEVVRSILREQRAQEMRNRSFARTMDVMRKQLDKKD